MVIAALSRIVLVLTLATLGVVLAAPTAQSNDRDRTTAQIAKKCKKKHQGKKKHRGKCKKTVPPTPTTVTSPAKTTPKCADDNLEPNDSIDEATPYPPSIQRNEDEGVICSPNSDFFTLTSTGTFGLGAAVVDIETLTPFAPSAKLSTPRGSCFLGPKSPAGPTGSA
jgi:hypothetical protein